MPILESRPLPLIPTKVGIQGRFGKPRGIEAKSRNKPCRLPWIPTFVGMSGAIRSDHAAREDR